MADRLNTDRGTYDGSQLMAALAQQGGPGVAQAIEQLQQEQAMIRQYLEQLAANGFSGGPWAGVPLFSTTVAQTGASVAFTVTGWISTGCLLAAEVANPHIENGTWNGLGTLAVGGKSLANAVNLPPSVLDLSRMPQGGGFRLDTSGQNLTGVSNGAAGAAVNPAIVITLFAGSAADAAGVRGS